MSRETPHATSDLRWYFHAYDDPVTFTAEGAFLRGNRPTVVADACATRPLRSAGTELAAAQIHHGALATIADLYGVVVPSQRSLI